MYAPPLASIVLAAGESRRMGEPKLFLPILGSSMLRRAVAAVKGFGITVVVTGAYDQEIREHLADIDHLIFTYNAEWQAGMAGSIAAGVKAAAAYKPDGFLVTVADQPLLGKASLRRHFYTFMDHPESVVATWYPERLGVPAIFPARFTDDLLSGEGSRGARQLIAKEGDAVKVVRYKEPPEDIDTPEDYRRISARIGQSSPTNDDPS
ncbi:nucleotidyltransferase family protein [Neolewinella persica]|uniref:nucleotidyltransferase family protein n=1 Tax=Neolewinella persica TaxID=70998 RepID=UPI000476EF5A|nr:nucleotidyltransferase family protein [Neolewinella persica]